jgi:chlorosome envelope protein I
MPTVTVIVNGVAMEAKLGERLLDVARRNGAHIGFVCDGAAICQTCQCRVLSGAEHLNPPNDAEKAWMPESRLDDGNRLACQAALRGVGQVEVLTTVEELRRQVLAVISPPAGSNPIEQLGPLVAHIVKLNVDQLAFFPLNNINTIQRLGLAEFFWPFKDLNRYIEDTVRVFNTTLGVEPASETSQP